MRGGVNPKISMDAQRLLFRNVKVRPDYIGLPYLLELAKVGPQHPYAEEAQQQLVFALALITAPIGISRANASQMNSRTDDRTHFQFARRADGRGRLKYVTRLPGRIKHCRWW